VKRKSARVFQVAVALIGILVLAFLLWEPHLEGRNAHATLFEIYFNDPFLAFAYLGSIAFFVALFQALKVLGYAARHGVLPAAAANSMRTIKYCAMVIVAFVVVGEIYIILAESDDRAGGVFMGVLIASGSIVVAATAAKIERNLRKAR
jgi:hypothetical protein